MGPRTTQLPLRPALGSAGPSVQAGGKQEPSQPVPPAPGFQAQCVALYVVTKKLNFFFPSLSLSRIGPANYNKVALWHVLLVIHTPHSDTQGYSRGHVVKIPSVLSGLDGFNEPALLLRGWAMVWAG